MSEPIEIREEVRVYIRDLDEAPDSVELEVADEDDPGEYYYEVPIDELGKRLGKRYVRYDGPEGRGFYDAARGELHTRPRRDDAETNENTVKNKIFEKADRILDKYKIYISDADTRAEAEQMAPEWADVQTTQQGAFYYEKLPGQGGDGGLDEDELEVGDYDVDSTFGKIVADRVLNDDVGDIPVDDFHEYMEEIDDPELVKDCLQAEMEGPNRKTGKQFIEVRANALDIDLDFLYKESGPDVSGEGSITSLIEMGVGIEDLPEGTITSPDENDYVDREWTYEEVWDVYIDGDKPLPTGMGNPDDIPAGTLSNALEEVDNPAVLMQFYAGDSYQIKGDVEDLLEDKGINPDVEMVESDLRFNLDEMDKYMPEDEVQDLNEGDYIVIDDFNGGFQEVEVVAVRNAGIEVKPAEGLGESMEIPVTNVFTDEFYLASSLEENGLYSEHGMNDWTALDETIERIEDDSVLTRAMAWHEGDNPIHLRPETRGRIKERLAEVSPPDPEEYDMDEDSMNLLHGASWPSWGTSVKAAGSGISQELRDVYNDASTEDLKKYREVCEDHDLDERKDVIDGMLWYRDDTDVEIQDLMEYERVAHGNYSGVTGDQEEKIMGAAEDTLKLMEPHAGAQLAAHIEKFELQNPPDGSNWAGQAQSGGRTMAIDDPWNVERTTSHEMGHALHNFMGIKNDGYGTIDNRDHKNDPDRWKFGAKSPSGANEDAEEFYDAMKEEWESYKQTAKGESDDAHELRSYQKRHGVELMAVGFGHWVQDPYKLRNRHPGLAEVFDKHCGAGVTDNVEAGDVSEGQFYDVAKEGTGRMTVRVDETYENSRGGHSYEVEVVEGELSGTRTTLTSDNSVFEGKSEDFKPLDTTHGQKVTVDFENSGETEVYIDQKTRAMGGDFRLVDEMGNERGQWTTSQLRESLVEQSGEKVDELPWHPEKADSGDLVEMHGVEVMVSSVDDWDNEITLEDSNGEKQTLSFDEVNDLRESGDFEPVDNVIDWDEMNSNRNYQFDVGDANYNGQVVGIDEDEVTIDQGRAGTSTVSRDEVEEVRRRV